MNTYSNVLEYFTSIIETHFPGAEISTSVGADFQAFLSSTGRSAKSKFYIAWTSASEGSFENGINEIVTVFLRGTNVREDFIVLRNAVNQERGFIDTSLNNSFRFVSFSTAYADKDSGFSNIEIQFNIGVE